MLLIVISLNYGKYEIFWLKLVYFEEKYSFFALLFLRAIKDISSGKHSKNLG